MAIGRRTNKGKESAIFTSSLKGHYRLFKIDAKEFQYEKELETFPIGYNLGALHTYY